MIKHVGKHNSRKIVIVYRQVPDEEHMALVLYSDVLPRLIHDEVMKVLESAVGQQSKDLADALWRNTMADGRNTLETVHREGFLKKVPTSQILVTPTTTSSVRLDELNDILNEMSKGEDAVKRLAELDASNGMTSKPKKSEPREVGTPAASRTGAVVEGNTSAEALIAGALSDSDLASQRLDQAAAMKAQAEQLLAEAKRLEKEAASLSPKKNATTRTKKTASKKQEA